MMPDMNDFISTINGDLLLDLVHGAPVEGMIDAFKKAAKEREEVLAGEEVVITGWKVGVETVRTLGFNYLPPSFRNNPQFVSQALFEFYRYWGSFALTFAALSWDLGPKVEALLRDFIAQKFRSPTAWTEQASKFPAFEIFAQHVFTQWSQACVYLNNRSSSALLLDPEKGFARWWPEKHRLDVCPITAKD